jgi:hypothetical protein
LRLAWDKPNRDWFLGLSNDEMVALLAVLRGACEAQLPTGTRRAILDLLTCYELTVERSVGSPFPLPPRRAGG